MMDNICSSCAYLIYDEDYEEYVCDCQMDEDDYSRILQGSYDEYRVVRKQM